MFGCSPVEMILPPQFVVFETKHDFYTEIHCSTHFYVNVLKNKQRYIQLTFK